VSVTLTDDCPAATSASALGVAGGGATNLVTRTP